MSWKETLRSNILLITAAIGLTGSAAGGLAWVDSRYAKADDVTELENRVELNELKDQLRTALEEYHWLRQQARKYPDDQDILDERDEAKDVVDDLKNRIKELGG
jgi:hypothetical protein